MGQTKGEWEGTMKTYREYMQAVCAARREYPEWRYGQTLYNVLNAYRPDLTAKIDGSWLDPFYKDPGDTAPFVIWLIDNLEK